MLKWKPSSRVVAMVATFAAVNIVSDSFLSLPEFPSGVWYSWNFMVEPLTGIVLGPVSGLASAFVGVMVGHYVMFIDVYEFLFTIGTPLGAAVSALLFRGKWKLVLCYYAVLFTAYFTTPTAWELPPWGMWDTYLAFAILLPAAFLMQKGRWKRNPTTWPLTLALAAFVGLEADVLFRICLFIPGQTYRLFYGFSTSDLQLIWVGGAIITPIKVALSVIATVSIGYPLMKASEKLDLVTSR